MTGAADANTRLGLLYLGGSILEVCPQRIQGCYCGRYLVALRLGQEMLLGVLGI